ncbi:protein of unknown function [Raineyella antarctica]|uniref:DUF3846 domain-containing protein n=1 Tax=Raineyella antarctica TaxID=1577474 RepID=A0A1G6GYY8_9ACTN|nr:DUF3846 domain-containing protein [Raineyella antarctica]SDB87219.1 protein of unknown function [Raineyella antarctica]
MPRGIIIPADENSPCVTQEFIGLKDYRQAVGGLIEPVDLPRIGATIYVNEEGLILDLPLNVRATILRWFWMPDTLRQSTLVGDAVLVGMPDPRGDTTDLPDWFAKNVLCTLGHYVEIKLVTRPEWYANRQRFASYFEAAVWARAAAERSSLIEEVRIVSPCSDQPS